MSYNERSAFQAEVAHVEQWWKVGSFLTLIVLKAESVSWQDARFSRVKRPYTAAQVVSKRGTLPISYPSDVLAKKLWATLSEHFKRGTPSHTYGA